MLIQYGSPSVHFPLCSDCDRWLAFDKSTKNEHSPHGLLSIGHCCLDDAVPIHCSKQCIWKTCVHSPHTVPPTYSQPHASDTGRIRVKLTQRTVVTRHLACWTASFEWNATDTANVPLAIVVGVIVAGVPAPLGNRMPLLDLHLHGRVV